jgi:hypothetical protein
LLEASLDGYTEAIMLAHGFKIELLIDLARGGLATTSTERMLPAGDQWRSPVCADHTADREYNNHHMSDHGDTRAMTCQNSCTPTTASAVANPAAPTGGSAYSLGCTTQQLVSKQRC